MAKRGNIPLKISVALAMLAAISIILGKFLAFGIGSVLRFSFENLPIIFAGALFGPIAGGAVGLLADLIGCVLVGYEINPLVTLGAVSIGVVSGVVYAFLCKIKLPLILKVLITVLLSHLIGSVAIKTIGLSRFYEMNFFILLLWRLLNYVLVGAAECALLYAMLKNRLVLDAVASLKRRGISIKARNGKALTETNNKGQEDEKMTYDEAIQYIHGISWTFCKPGLDRISELCERLGHPERELKFVHVAGTNGKGSFSSMLESILRSAGYKTGLYTSPYIVDFEERMRFLGENIDKNELAEITEYVKPIAESMADKPTEFELICAIAFEFFKRKGAEIVVLEAGMGGRLDSTNIIESSLLSVITGISLDHTAFLGDTTLKIAKEKGGIIKDGTPLLFGGEDADITALLSEMAKSKNSKLYKVSYEELKIKKSTLAGTTLDYKDFTDIKIKLLGLYQPRNTAIVLESVRILRERGFNISDEAVKAGLSSAAWPARFEIISREPLIIFDGAHNPEGIEGAARSIEHYFKKEPVIAISGVLRDKDYEKIAERISSVASDVYTITPDSPRALSASEYKDALSAYGTNASATTGIDEALRLATEKAAEYKKAVVILGSLYTYTDVIRALKKVKHNEV